MSRVRIPAAIVFVLVLLSFAAYAQNVTYTDQEKAVSQQLRELRQMQDDRDRGALTRKLAIEIRQLPITIGKVRLANALQNLSTEGDFGHDTLQEVTDTLTLAIQQYERTGNSDPLPYFPVAFMVRYEGVKTSLNGPKYESAMADLEASERLREKADFTLADLQGKTWTLSDLKGKVVIVNFWATWCPPCVKEIPDLQELYERFKGQGLVVLGIADDDPDTLKKFVAERKVPYPVLPDVDRKVNTAFDLAGLPVSLVYDREGRLIGQYVPTRAQLLRVLAQAGIH